MVEADGPHPGHEEQPIARSPADDAPAPADAAPRKRRSYLPAKERRRLIIAAAQEVFARSSLQGARTREIARAAEVNQATVFEHFESKEALFHAAVVEPLLAAMRGMHGRAQEYAAAGSGEEVGRLARGSAERQLETMRRVFPLFTAALFSDQALGRTLYLEQIAPLLAERAGAIAPLVRDGLDPAVVELANFGILFALAMDSHFRGDGPDGGALAEQITRLAVTGFVRERP